MELRLITYNLNFNELKGNRTILRDIIINILWSRKIKAEQSYKN